MLTLRQRLDQLRKQLKIHEIDTYLIPTADAHFSEYPPESDARRKYITGFTGSAGTAVVTLTEALLWTDGRYFTQAEDQLDASCWKMMKDGLPETPSISTWLKTNPNVHVVGYDPTVTSIPFYKQLSEAFQQDCSDSNSQPSKICKPTLDHNLVDLVWNHDGRPAQPASQVYLLRDQLTGASSEAKMAAIQAECVKSNVDGCVLSLLDDVAWVMNMRGSDIDYCPVFLAYMLITPEHVRLYVNGDRLSPECKDHLNKISVELKSYDAIFADIRSLFGDSQGSSKLWLDADANMKLYHCVHNAKQRAVVKMSPAQLPKAIKTPEELDGMKEAHIKDALAEITFLAWLERTAEAKGDDGLREHTEWTVTEKLDGLRKLMPDNLGLSFNTISSIGPNGAVIHYGAKKEIARTLSKDLYLVDSGGQYLQGTTDVTRTLHLGSPTETQKQCWTRVLKGHLQLARQVFPKGTKGPQLDVLARQYLWNIGIDYLHGTGHGVGSFLNVHEGPQRISPSMKGTGADVALVPGMVVSNEPGYYKPGDFGVRIENLVFVKQVEALNPGLQTTDFYGFEDLTLIPQLRQLDVSTPAAAIRR